MSLQKTKVNPIKTISGKEQSIITMIDEGMVDMKRTPYAPSYNDRKSWFAVFYKFVPDGIGVAGIRYAFNPREIRTRRLIWLSLVLTACFVMSYQVIDRILFYTSHPKDVDISINYKNEVPFPSVAICNVNPFKRSAVRGTVFEDFLPDLHYNGSRVNLTAYRSELEKYEMTDVFDEMGHGIRDTIKAKMWNGRRLSYANFTRRVTDAGVCIVFNDVDNGLPQLMVQSSGMRHGLDLKLNAEQENYYFHHSYQIGAGFQVLLYDYGTEPVVEKGAFAISIGVETQVAVDITEYHNLQRPHGHCENNTLKYFDTYGYSECASECLTDFLLQRCNCSTLAMHTQARECTAYEFFNCILPSYDAYVREVHEQSCHCPVACFNREYTSSVSTLTSPSIHWATHSADFFNVPPRYFEINICSLVIFMKDLSIETVSQQIKYPFFSLLCDIGGSLGLWLGGSILTVFEVFDLFSISTYVYTKMNQRR